MKNKFIVILILSFALCSALVILSFAHPGKTDEYGGHYDYEAGEYHYHHGYPAHQHPDGVCPYNFDDKTDHSSGSSSYSDNEVYEYEEYDDKYGNDYDYEDYEKTTTDSVEDDEKKSSSNLKDILEGILTWFFGIVAGLWILFYVGTFFYVLISDKIKKRIKNKKDK